MFSKVIWFRHPVLFADGLIQLLSDQVDILLHRWHGRLPLLFPGKLKLLSRTTTCQAKGYPLNSFRLGMKETQQRYQKMWLIVRARNLEGSKQPPAV